nr:neuroblastoma breakpoint family member 6 isoform X2 [Oryctolagus cuniculus]
MALPLGPSRDMRVETREQLRSQLARSQQKSKELKEKLLRSEAMSYLLANHLREHNCEEHKHLIEPVLRKKPQFLEGQLAAELRPVRHHKKRGVQIQEQAQELTQLPRKSREGRALSQLTHQNLQALLTQQDPDSCRRQQLLAELLRLTEHLAGTLSTVDQKSGNQEEPYVDSPHTSGPELKLPQLGQFPISHEANAGPCWPCPPAGPSAVTYLQDCAAGSRCLQREECPIFWAKAMCVCPTVLDPVQPFLCPALPRPELVVPQLEHFNVPCAANAGPCWLCPMVSLLVSHQVCSGIWDFKHEDQLCRAVGHGGYPMYEEKVAGYLGPPIPKVCLRLPKPEQPEFLLSPVACPYPPLTMPSLVDCTCPTVGSDWGHVQVPHFRLFVSASETLKACPQKHLHGVLGCHLSKVPISHAELWARLQGYACPQVPVDLQLASGSNEARLSDSSSTCSFAENMDSRNQWLLHKEPVTDGCLGSSPKQRDNTIEGSTTSSHASQVSGHPEGSDVLKKMIQRKRHFTKWRLSYRIPGFQLEVQRYQELMEIWGPVLDTMKVCQEK